MPTTVRENHWWFRRLKIHFHTLTALSFLDSIVGMEFRRTSLERFHLYGTPPRYVPPDLRKIVRRKLIMIARSTELNDLRIPPSNRLEQLKGNLEGYYSIRVNAQWRIIFRWNQKGAVDVDFIDYH
ncbi:type II toxin-antitoxin system RelE/ParE family toxin [Corynebacterium macclintockiae]|uniref:type II toxin-antitoxin system RelE/ParE family toxin n=3 Tax=Corynebacterium TaxID=1716 RepID=UPI003EC0777E